MNKLESCYLQNTNSSHFSPLPLLLHKSKPPTSQLHYPPKVFLLPPLPLELLTSSSFCLLKYQFTEETFHDYPFLKLQLPTPSIPYPSLPYFSVLSLLPTNILYVLIPYHVKQKQQEGRDLYLFINQSLMPKLTITYMLL